MEEYVTAIIAALSAIGGAAVAHYFAQRQWRSQQQWAAREKHYMELLSHLAKAKMSFKNQGMYYLEPGTEYHDYSGDENFVRQGQAARAAMTAIEELTGPARVFLSPQATQALDNLLQEEWHASYDGRRRQQLPGQSVGAGQDGGSRGAAGCKGPTSI